MKSLKIFSALFLAVIMVIGVGSAAYAAKSLEVGTDNVLNTGDESVRTADLYITLKGGFDDVNGLAFTLLYDKDVFDFVGLTADTISLYDGDTYDPNNPPDEVAEEAIASSDIVYMANDKPDEGRVLIAAAAANFLANDTNDVVPFVAQFRVKEGLGNGFYPINAQQTIIGPNTAYDAGYHVFTPISVAVGLDPAADPTTATDFEVQLTSVGGITVGGGYAISGSVQYEGGTNADGAVVRLFRNVGNNYFLNDTTTVNNGQFVFNAKPNGTYKIVVLATNPGFQRRYTSEAITVDGDHDVGTIILAAYAPLAGNILVNGLAIPGVRAKVMDGTTLIGYFPVDANGNFVTTPLYPLINPVIIAVYGIEESDPFTGDLNWSLDVGTMSGTISGLTSGHNVMIHIMSANAQLEKTLNKIGDGNDIAYQFKSLLPATDYIVSVVGDGIQVSYYDGISDAGVPDINDAVLQTVMVDHDTDNIDFVFSSVTTTIEGQISEGGTGVTGVPVFAFETETTEPAIYSGFSGENGAYSLLVEDGTYIVFAYKNNGKTFYYNSIDTTQIDAEAEPVIVSGSSITGKNINLDEQDGVITGQVTYKRLGGDPVAGIMVMAEGPKGSAIDVTDENGKYTLSGLYNEEHNVTIYPNKPYPPQTESVDASSDGTVKNFVIHTGWVLSGAVTKEDDSNTKVNGAWVYLTNSSGMMQGVPAFTDIDGKFTLADIPSGIYTLNAEHPDYQPKSVAMDIQADVSDYELTMIQGASIIGTVFDTDGTSGLGDVMIIATAIGDVAHYAFTNDDGEYEINGLVDSTDYFLMVNKQGYLRQFVSTMVPQANFDFTLQVPGNRYNFGGIVQETGGNAINGAIVVVSSVSKNFGDSTITANGGQFNFSQLVSATDYKIVVIPGGNRPVYIEDYDLNTTVTDYVINIPIGTITGTVTLSDFANSTDVTVYLIDANGDYVTDVTANDQNNGTYNYTFDGIEASMDFKVVAFASSYGMGWYNGTTFDEADPVQSGDSGIDMTLTLQ